MADEEAHTKQVALRTSRRLLHPDEPPTGIHHVAFSRVGGEVVMDVGFFHLSELVEELNKAKPSAESGGEVVVEATVNVVAQYAMAADAFLRLRENVEQIYRAMVKSGDIKEVEPETGEGK